MGCGVVFFFWIVGFSEVFEELAHDAFGAACGGVFVVLGWWGQEAEVGVGGDLFYLGWLGLLGVLAGEVRAGDLEAVEEQAGSARVDGVGGYGGEDLADGVLDGRAVFGHGEVESAGVRCSFAWVCYGLAGGVVVVAEGFSA